MAKSILQTDKTHCFLCGMNQNLEPLDKHHVFGAALRDKSEKYGLTVYLHHCKCHLHGVHAYQKMREALQEYAQKKAMEHYGWSKEEFREKFGRSFL